MACIAQFVSCKIILTFQNRYGILPFSLRPGGEAPEASKAGDEDDSEKKVMIEVAR